MIILKNKKFIIWSTVTIAGLLSLNAVEQVSAEDLGQDQGQMPDSDSGASLDLPLEGQAIDQGQSNQVEESNLEVTIYPSDQGESGGVEVETVQLSQPDKPDDVNTADDSFELKDNPADSKVVSGQSENSENSDEVEEKKREILEFSAPIDEEKAYVEANTPDPQPGFRVLPYLQKPSSDSMRISWISELGSPARITLKAGGKQVSQQVIEPQYMEIMEYTRAEVDENISHAGKTLPKGEWLYSNSNYKYDADFDKLVPNTEYTYMIEMDGQKYQNTFKTFPTKDDWDHIRLAAFSDTETEPKGAIEQREWELHTTNPYTSESEPRPGQGSDFAEKHGASTRNDMFLVNYPIDQQTALNENLAHLAEANLDALLIAGDLTQGSGYQPAWDEFWRHFAGNFNDFASNVPLITALGNWETTAALSGDYGSQADRSPVVKARNRYHAYISTPDYPGHEQHKSSYYRTDIGPITILTLDSTNGLPDEDVNQGMLTGEKYTGDDSILQEELWYKGKEYDPYITTDTQGSFTAEEYANAYPKVFPGTSPEDSDLPAFNPGSLQWKWAVEQLQDAREKGQIIVVQFHHAPYSSGVHGMAPNFSEPDNQSGVAMRVYSPLFEKYGVSLVIAGHDEMFERSFVDLDGDGRGFHVYDVGVAADGLRGEKVVRDEEGKLVPLNFNTYSQWSATANEPETWLTNENGVKHLVDGGLHYGHLQIDLVRTDYGSKMILQPVYLFPILDDDYNFVRTERRVYDDVVVMHFDHDGLEIIDFQEEFTFKFINSTTKGSTSFKSPSIGEAKKYFDQYAKESGLGDLVWTFDPDSRTFTAVGQDVIGKTIADIDESVYNFLAPTPDWSPSEEDQDEEDSIYPIEGEASVDSVYDFQAPSFEWNTDQEIPDQLKVYTLVYITQNTRGKNGATTVKAGNPEEAEKYFRNWASENGLGDLDWAYDESSRTFTAREKVEQATTIEGESSVDAVYDFLAPDFIWNTDQVDSGTNQPGQESSDQKDPEADQPGQESPEQEDPEADQLDPGNTDQEDPEEEKPNSKTLDKEFSGQGQTKQESPDQKSSDQNSPSKSKDFSQGSPASGDQPANQALPDTATGTWALGLLGLTTLFTGFLTSKNKEN